MTDIDTLTPEERARVQQLFNHLSELDTLLKLARKIRKFDKQMVSAITPARARRMREHSEKMAREARQELHMALGSEEALGVFYLACGLALESVLLEEQTATLNEMQTLSATPRATLRLVADNTEQEHNQ